MFPFNSGMAFYRAFFFLGVFFSIQVKHDLLQSHSPWNDSIFFIFSSGEMKRKLFLLVVNLGKFPHKSIQVIDIRTTKQEILKSIIHHSERLLKDKIFTHARTHIHAEYIYIYIYIYVCVCVCVCVCLDFRFSCWYISLKMTKKNLE